MASFNKVFLIGNLTKDPELRYTGTGVPIANIRLAISHKYKTSQGELKDEVCYINVVVFGKQAVPCNDYLKKGSPVFIEGRLRSRSWESDGQKKSTIEVTANRVQFMSTGRKETEGTSVESDAVSEFEPESGHAEIQPSGAAAGSLAEANSWDDEREEG